MCKLFYATTGTWCDDPNLLAVVDTIKENVDALDIFDEEVEFQTLGAKEIKKLYRETKENISVTINFDQKVLLPEIEGVSEAYLGILPVMEYMKLLEDELGNIRKSVFYDNVRDYQGENPVNQDISDTITSDQSDQLVVLNNGITIVAKSISYVRNQYTLSDYQIVNGCQTSHVLYYSKEFINENMHLPIKLIVTQKEDVINRIIKATNRQTEVKEEELIALSEFQKELESFYETYTGDSKLYYERRSKQYNAVNGIEKARIVNISTQIRTFASMFLDQPHKASRFFGTLVKDIGNNIFDKDHQLVVYYTSAYAMYKLEYLFRNKYLDSEYRKFKYHMLMLLKYKVTGEKPLFFNSNKIVKYCEEILTTLDSFRTMLEVFIEITDIIDSNVTNLSDNEITKKQSLNKKLLKSIGVLK